jgi:hypothetical protein
MLQQSVYVILYSKFSIHSKKFIDIVRELDINFTYLCTDNSNIRKRILNDKKLLVQNIPCLLQIDTNTGNVIKYDGNDAFIWVNELLLQKNNKLMSFQQESKIQQQQKKPQETTTNIDELDDSNENDNNIIEDENMEEDEHTMSITHKQLSDYEEKTNSNKKNNNKIDIQTAMRNLERNREKTDDHFFPDIKKRQQIMQKVDNNDDEL